MNRLELALLDESGFQLDFYLEDESTKNIMKHIQEIKEKAMCSTDSGIIKKKLQEFVDSI